MKITELTALGIRISGAILAAEAIASISLWVHYFRSDSAYSGQFDPLIFTSGTAYLLVVLAMVFCPISIAKMIVPRSSDESPILNIESVSFEAVALTILGIFMLAMAAPDLAYYIFTFSVHAVGYSELNQSDFWDNVNGAVTTCIEIAIAGYLLLGAPSVLRLVHKLRAYGQQ